jgi:hypothetical protein
MLRCLPSEVFTGKYLRVNILRTDVLCDQNVSPSELIAGLREGNAKLALGTNLI